MADGHSAFRLHLCRTLHRSLAHSVMSAIVASTDGKQGAGSFKFVNKSLNRINDALRVVSIEIEYVAVVAASPCIQPVKRRYVARAVFSRNACCDQVSHLLSSQVRGAPVGRVVNQWGFISPNLGQAVAVAHSATILDRTMSDFTGVNHLICHLFFQGSGNWHQGSGRSRSVQVPGRPTRYSAGSAPRRMHSECQHSGSGRARDTKRPG